MSKWTITWMACFSTISKARIESIEAYIEAKIEGLKPSELDDAVEQLALGWNAKEQGQAPGIGLLIKTIKGNRLRAIGIDASEPYEYTQMKREVARLPTNTLERWEVICKAAMIGGHDAKWGFALERYAAKEGGFTLPWWVAHSMHPLAKWQMPKPTGVDSWTDALRKAGEARQGAGRDAIRQEGGC